MLRVSFVITFLSFVFYVLLLIGGLFSCSNGEISSQVGLHCKAKLTSVQSVLILQAFILCFRWIMRQLYYISGTLNLLYRKLKASSQHLNSSDLQQVDPVTLRAHWSRASSILTIWLAVANTGTVGAQSIHGKNGTVKRETEKNGNGKSGYQKIGQPENSATRTERVGKTRQQKIYVRKKGNRNFGSRKMRGQDVFRSRFQFSSVYVLWTSVNTARVLLSILPKLTVTHLICTWTQYWQCESYSRRYQASGFLFICKCLL